MASEQEMLADLAVADKSGDTQLAQHIAGLIKAQRTPAPSSNTDVAINAANKGIAALPDSILNAPNNVLNLLKAGFGTAAGALGRNDLMPELTPNPDWARRTLEAAGAINPAIQPQGFVQKAIDYGTQGAVGGALTGGGGLGRTIAGAALGTASGLAAGGTQEATGNPALAATAGMLPGGAAGVRNAVQPVSGKTPLLQSGNPVKDETFARANAEGYVVPPSAMKPTWAGNRIEGLAGKAALGQEASIRNQAVTNKIAGKEAGLAPNEPISIDTLSAAREKLAAPYREVEALTALPAKQIGAWNTPTGSSPIMGKAPSTPAELVRDWKSNNSTITELWRDYSQNHKVETLEAYRAARAKQETIESDIEKTAIANKRPDLVPALRQARVDLAKNYDVERALNLGDGNVDASMLGRMYDKAPARYKGSSLELIGKFQQAFPNSAREASKVPAPGVSKLEGWGSLGLALAGHAAAPGSGELLGALPLAISPAARAFALSPRMQGGRDLTPGALSQSAQNVPPIITQGILADILRQRQ